MALSTDTSILTAVGNDYGYHEVFARQVAGLGRPGDVLIGISTSGHSENVIRAVEQAQSMGMKTVGLLGRDGGNLKHMVDQPIVVTAPRRPASRRRISLFCTTGPGRLSVVYPRLPGDQA
jgi:D-sedoheptulose 7-phosphate isomerase